MATPVTGIVWDAPIPRTANVGTQVQLRAHVTPSNASVQTLTWRLASDNETSATLTPDGKLTAHAEGAVRVYAIAENGKKTE
jgi:uncharacterized protein YjdB